ncbi:hypothetical protein TVAG_453710 [Trichomonas vaginalis G3]|uniref:Uncharacterized protein n=1 Tax=Trichomonas vaginalis (strain ATCC PRA-98 / G3) TaxID=412133 RepID=A2DPU7_TRIV3|nr:hypothetical protein TVAGG3_0552140 [Trichomonas vaginalis G3]EAY17543.1 hypothetical protein TVAG_453710 [Trichomonas vaginalis G3]KAI5520587.1 hypothetical protein TVAGG3_0552140 [Trichomonas vaginalis G3]|eukprot:XP_001329678.1 hypothetical protein [Trichomonas vaginalis G3]
MSEVTHVHVCSLSTSALSRIQKNIDNLSSDDKKDIKHRLMWLKVAIKYNIQEQTQYIYNHCGMKGKDPKFRAIRMAPFYHQWKRQCTRDDWNDLLVRLTHKNALVSIRETMGELHRGRSEIAARNFAKSSVANFCPLISLISSKNDDNCDLAMKKLDNLISYENPITCRPGYNNRGIEFLATDAVRTLSTVPPTTDE